jgi:hypothetical protein
MAIPDPPFDRLYSDIKISIPGAIDAVIQQEMYRTFEDFLIETNIWTEEIPFNVEPNKYTYVVTPSGNSGIVRLLMVFDPAQAWPEKRWTQQGIAFQPPNKINLMYSPSTETIWTAAVSKKIVDPQIVHLPVIDDDYTWIIDRYRDAFVHGTLGKLFMQPAKPYSNPQLAGFHRQNYIAKRGRARADVLHANVYGGQRWMYPQGYATTARKGWT